MNELLKGNFTPKKQIKHTDEQQASLEERFEKEALKKLGGSIAFVAKKKVMWGDEEDDEAGND